MKTILLFLTLAAALAHADTYVLYSISGGPKLFEGASQDEFLNRAFSNQSTIDIFIQTDSSKPQGTRQTYTLEFVSEWDAAGTPKATASREIGSKFRVSEDGDSVSFSYSNTKLEGWTPASPPKLILQPVISSHEINTAMSMPRCTKILLGGFNREEIVDGESKKIYGYIIIERK